MTRAAVAAMLAVLALAPSRAAAQDDPMDPYGPPPADPTPDPTPTPTPTPDPIPSPAAEPDDDIDDQVAQALHRRGLQLYERGDVVNARMLFSESLERSPDGTVAAESLRMLRACNQKLGRPEDEGRPGSGGDVVDPYGAGNGATTGADVPIDPYAAGATATGDVNRAAANDDGLGPARRITIAAGTAAGLTLGLALGGPEGDGNELAGTAIVGMIAGGAVGAFGSYYLVRDRELTAGQGNAIAAGTAWGTLDLALLGDAATGVDSDDNDVWKFAGVGAALGFGGGAYYAFSAQPTEGDIALVNSLSLYGFAGGLLVGVGMSPPESEAYSINALVGSAAGITAGILLAPRLDVSRRRTVMVDLGATAGVAASWALLYPLINDDDGNDDEQAVGWISTLALGGGAVAAWFLTRGMDDEPAARSARRGDPPPPPGLLQRTADGRWEPGVPALRPVTLPSPDAPSPRGVAIDLLAGRF